VRRSRPGGLATVGDVRRSLTDILVAPFRAVTGRLQDLISYDPHPDGAPDPGEVVWAWVPYEEDNGDGKDRPVLLIGRRGTQLLALMLTSKDHDRDEAEEAAHGRHWMDVGSGGWDREHRPSEVRLDRLLVLEASGVRREGAALAADTFAEVLAGARGLGTIS
jgi:hypothetical protein